jgi:hypothetical protein
MRTIGAALAAALLATMTLAGAIEAGGGGCAINVTYVNRESTQSRVDLGESDVKSKQLGIWGPWARIGWADDQTGILRIPANGRKTRAHELGFPCSYPRRYRFKVLNGGDSKFVYKPSSTGQTTRTDLTVTIDF